MNPTELPLRDIHLPPAVGWWPPAPGWWIVGALLVGLVLWWLVRFWRRRAQRAALRALGTVTRRLARGEAPALCVQQISTILRRYAITIAPDRERVAGLAGAHWLEYLDSRWRRQAFTSGAGRALAAAPYAAPASVSAEQAQELRSLGIAWVKAQRS